MRHILYSKTYILIVALVAISLSSCSVLGIFNKDGQQARPVVTPSDKDIVTVPAAPSEKTVEPSNVVKETISTAAETATTLDGRWEIYAVGRDTLPVLDEVPYVTFNPQENQFYAFNGCNIINGSYRETPDHHIALENVLSTMRMCQDVPLQYEITTALTDGKQYTFSLKPSDGIVTLTLVDVATGHRAMTLIHRHLSWLNGQWQVTRIGDRAYDDEEMNLYFDMPEMSVHGNTGCNFFNGSLTTDAAVPYSLNFGRMGVTKMACPDTSTETAMLVALESTAAARPSGHDGAVLLAPDGKILLTLRRVDTTQSKD